MDNNMFGGLLEFSKQEELNKFLDEMSSLDAIRIIEVGLEYGLKNGLYSLSESHILYLSLIKITQELKKDNDVK